jgi:hypothetical protein
MGTFSPTSVVSEAAHGGASGDNSALASDDDPSAGEVLFQIPRQADGSVNSDDLKRAIEEANRKLEGAQRANLWAKMTRRMQSKDCPPLIKEKWSECKSKNSKNEMFGLWLACGGNAGKMTAIEQITQSETVKAANSKVWMTADDLTEKFHGNDEAVQAIIKQCLTDPSLYRNHPDLPNDAKLCQYHVHDATRTTTTNAVQKLKSLHWTGHVTGQTGLEMAKCIEDLFAASTGVPSSASALPEPSPKPKPRKPAPKKASKTVTDCRKVYVDALRTRCNDYMSIMRELRSRLGPHEWASALRTAMETEIKWFESGHDTFAALAAAPYTDADLDPVLADFRLHVQTCSDYISAADSMLNNKKRKLPAEPVRPAAGSEPANAA